MVGGDDDEGVGILFCEMFGDVDGFIEFDSFEELLVGVYVVGLFVDGGGFDY